MGRGLTPLSKAVRFLVWRERISHEAEAWTAYGEVVRNGRLFAASTMLLADSRYSGWNEVQGKLILKFVEEARSGKFIAYASSFGWHGLPFVGFIRDLRR